MLGDFEVPGPAPLPGPASRGRFGVSLLIKDVESDTLAMMKTIDAWGRAWGSLFCWLSVVEL